MSLAQLLASLLSGGGSDDSDSQQIALREGKRLKDEKHNPVCNANGVWINVHFFYEDGTVEGLYANKHDLANGWKSRVLPTHEHFAWLSDHTNMLRAASAKAIEVLPDAKQVVIRKRNTTKIILPLEPCTKAEAVHGLWLFTLAYTSQNDSRCDTFMQKHNALATRVQSIGRRLDQLERKVKTCCPSRNCSGVAAAPTSAAPSAARSQANDLLRAMLGGSAMLQDSDSDTDTDSAAATATAPSASDDDDSVSHTNSIPLSAVLQRMRGIRRNASQSATSQATLSASATPSATSSSTVRSSASTNNNGTVTIADVEEGESVPDDLD